MTSPTAKNEPNIVRKSRVLPKTSIDEKLTVPLSLLDATTAKFGLTSAIWLLERPTVSFTSTNITNHLRTTLSLTLDAYPQWCGYLRSVLSINQNGLPLDTAHFPQHARRYGRVYVQYGTSTDPGVEFIEATSTATVDDLYDANYARMRPVWNRRGDEMTLAHFVPSTNVVLALEPNEKDMDGLYKPIMAVQCTELACGGGLFLTKLLCA